MPPKQLQPTKLGPSSPVQFEGVTPSLQGTTLGSGVIPRSEGGTPSIGDPLGDQELAIPDDGLHIDPAWFEALLRAHGHDTSIRSINAEPIGGGLMGSNVRYCFDYSDAADDVPTSLIGKFPATSSKTVESEGVVRAYLQEVRFYQALGQNHGGHRCQRHGLQASMSTRAVLPLFSKT